MSVSVTALPSFLLSGTSIKKIYASKGGDSEICKDKFKTNFSDEKTLIKTLKEHSAADIEVNEGIVTCKCSNYALKFVKDDTGPYIMSLIHYANDGKINEFAENINNEYAANVQESSYNLIKERLKEKNLQIEDEEYYDDNTIVLTVNLD